MTDKEINAAFHREVLGLEVLGPESEAMAREVLRGYGGNGLPSEYCVFVRVEVERLPYPKQVEIQPRALPPLQTMLTHCLDFFDFSLRKTVKFTPVGVWVNDSYSDYNSFEFALAEAMIIEWRKDKDAKAN